MNLFQVVMIVDLTNCFEETIELDVKASFANSSESRLII